MTFVYQFSTGMEIFRDENKNGDQRKECQTSEINIKQRGKSKCHKMQNTWIESTKQSANWDTQQQAGRVHAF